MNVNSPGFGPMVSLLSIILMPAIVYLGIWLGDVWERAVARRRARMGPAK